MLRALICVMSLLCVSGAPALAQTVDVSRFVDPMTVRSASLSANGEHVVFIRRTSEGEEIVVANSSATEARVMESIRNEFGRFNWVAWEGDDHILAGVEAYVGRERDRRTTRGFTNRGGQVSIFRVISISRDGSQFVQMFEGQGQSLAWGFGSTLMLDRLPNDPGHVLLMATDNLGVGVWRADVRTGAVERVSDGTWDTRYYGTDGAGYPVMRVDFLASGAGYRILRRASGQTPWTPVMDVRGDLLNNSPDFQILGAGPGANEVYVFARRDGQQDRAAIYLYNTSTGAFGDPIYAGVDADPDDLWLHPVSRQVIAGCTFAQRLACQAREPAVQRHMNAVNGFFGGAATVRLTGMSSDANKWLLRVQSPPEAAGYFIYDVAARSVTPLALVYPSIDLGQLSPTSVVEYTARDGTPLWAYVTARPGQGPRPMVVMPHGGPEARDVFGYDSFAQYLAAQGYVVVQPNFRGSSGFGRAFAEAGRGQWGLRMQDDVTDAVRHMIDSGVADPQRVCIVGASYGGYAALAGAALTPDLYRCAVSIAGVSDLLDMLRSERAQGGRSSATYQYWRRSIGDPGVNRDALIAASPARQANRISAAVLLIHGEDDETVLIDQSEGMERALREAGRPARLVRIEGEDHYWNSWSTEHRATLYQETSAFLAQHLQ
jgi:dipeptidyl aminopeptidase/acylaminoacyl peptidase